MSEREKPFVLIVDDHLPAAEMLSRLFDARGFTTETAYNGPNAIAIATALIPDLILLDVMMPGMNGFEVIEKLRSDPKTARIPTIFITAKDDAASVEEGLKLGADDYLPKPVKPRELIARVNSKIEARRLNDALAQRTRDLEAMLRMSSELNKLLELEDLLPLVLYLAMDLIPVRAGVVYHLSEDGEILEMHEAKKYSDTQFSYDESALFDLAASTYDVVTWHNEQVATLPSGIVTQMRYGDVLHGIIALFYETPLAENHIRLFEGMAQQITAAIRNAELYDVKVEYAERLEDMVEERTAELRAAQEMLIRSEKLASVGYLAAGIAHEINNPLLPLQVNLEGMLEDLEIGAAITRRDIEVSLQSVKRIARIVETLQKFTKKQPENAPLMSDVEVISIINDVIGLSQNYFNKNGIEVDTSGLSDSTIYGNRDQLEQVFLNLVMNAKAAMNEMGGKLIISSQEHKGVVVLKFRDTGSGINPDKINRIFEPFMTTKAEGTGLGLFISHHIIEGHNGKIEVESAVGSGTVFTLTLPTAAVKLS